MLVIPPETEALYPRPDVRTAGEPRAETIPFEGLVWGCEREERFFLLLGLDEEL